jgi:membrane fusion protein, multidrug efflux system
VIYFGVDPGAAGSLFAGKFAVRVLTQIAVIAVLGATGYGAWYGYQQYYVTAAPTQGQNRASNAIPVEVAAARIGTVSEVVEAVGTARANEAVVITAKQPGFVKTINFTEGQTVPAGTILVELESRERKAELDAALSLRDESRRAFERAEQLFQRGAFADARVKDLKGQLEGAEARVSAAQARLKDLVITAPFGGRVGMREVSAGALVQPGATLTTLDDTERVKIEFSVPETALARLKPGLSVAASTAAYGKERFRGTVTVIDTRIDPLNRAVRVSSLFDNRDGRLKPGMFMTVELVLDQRDQAVLVPEEAVVPAGDRQVVFVVESGRAKRREVTIGRRQGGEVEIFEGVKAGDAVITTGLQRVRDGIAVQPRRVAAPANQS